MPTADRLQGRGMMGEGVIELRRIRAAVEAAGYDGPIEVEVINREAWARPGAELVARRARRFAAAACSSAADDGPLRRTWRSSRW